MAISSRKQDYQEKFAKIAPRTRFFQLPDTEQEFLREKACQLKFTQQELRLVSDMALDRTRWKESPLSGEWPVDASYGDAGVLKKRLLMQLQENQEILHRKDNDYGNFLREDKPRTQRPVLKTAVQPKLGLGRCPVASERTRCCNLLTLDAVEKCGFDCSYCSIQSFYHGNEVKFDRDFADKLSKLELDPGKTYHIGTGQSSDSLMWGNHQGILEALFAFAQRHPNVILELKTKSKNIGWLLKNEVPGNVICTWSLNPQTIIDNEEHLSASLEHRLDSAGELADKGCIVGFHMHPIIHYSDWQADYSELCRKITSRFDPGQVAMVSMGTLTFTKSVMKTIRQRDLASKILQMPMEETAGKYSYPLDIKLQLFNYVYNELCDWHEKVFFYLCMEPQDLWNPVFGFDYDNNEDFEAAMKSSYFAKVNKLSN